MEWSGRVAAAAGTLGAVWFGWGAVALAQDEATAEAEAAAPTPVEASTAAAPDAPSELKKIVGTRAAGDDASAASQKRIDEVSDETDDLLAQYRTTLKQIDSIKLYNDQMRNLVAAQQAEIASLQDQIGNIQVVGRSVVPLMLRMVDAIEKFVNLDVPFLITERKKRIEELRTMMGRADISTPEKYRQIMEAYQIENEYGRTIEAYRATLQIGDKETTVDFLRFGRIALVYQSLDESVSGRWDQETRAWVPLDSTHRSSIRDGLRIARKQSAPDLIRLPLAAPVDERGSS